MKFKSEALPLYAFQIAIFLSLVGVNPTAGGGGEGSVLRQLGWITLVALCAIGVVATRGGWSEFIEGIKARAWAVAFICAFVLLAVASMGWSEAPFVTLKRATLLGVVVFIAIAANIRCESSGASLPKLLLAPLVVLLALSIVFSLVSPSVAFSNLGWQGLTGQKNTMGQLAAVLVIAVLLNPHSGNRKALSKAVFVLAGAVALVLSRSGTALLCLAAALACIGSLRLQKVLRDRPTWMVPAYFAVLFMLAVLFVMHLFGLMPSIAEVQTALLGAMGKSETFTGRAALWDLVAEQARYRSDWFGGGYGAFWDISYQRIAYIVNRLGFQPIQAHNGYLEVFNDLGYIGLALALVIVGYYLLRVLVALISAQDSHGVEFHLALCVYVLLANLSESSLFRTTQFLNLLFLFSLFVVAQRDTRKVKEHAPSLAGAIPGVNGAAGR